MFQRSTRIGPSVILLTVLTSFCDTSLAQTAATGTVVVAATGAAAADNTTTADESNKGSNTVLNTVVVEGIRDVLVPTAPTESVYGLDASVLDTPRSIYEINADQLSTDLILTADDLGKYAPGLTRGGGQNVQLTPEIRGQNSELFQDGQRIYSERHPTNYNSYEDADIVAGVSSVVLGPVGGDGGYVNYITKKPDFNSSHTDISAQLGTWVPDSRSHPTDRVTVDNTGPVSDTFAYRVSVTLQKSDDYLENVKNDYDAFFAALSWVPTSNLRIDWHASFDDYYDFNITQGWDRETQALVNSDGGEYWAGRVTPILRGAGANGTTITWSPVFASGNPTSPTIGWQYRVPVRTSNGSYSYTQYAASGPVQPLSTMPGATPQTAGNLLGFVYDPSLPGNGLQSIQPYQSASSQDLDTARRFTSQSIVDWKLSAAVSVVNSTLIGVNHDYLNSVGTFLGEWDTTEFEHRLELRVHREDTLFGLPLEHDSNSGVSYRRETETRFESNVDFDYDIFDLTQNPNNKYIGYVFGLFNQNPNANPAGGTGAWRGQPGVPQLSPYFGYFNLTPAYPVGDGLYAQLAPGYTYAYRTGTLSFFTQQNFKLTERFGINAGASDSFVAATAWNPLHPAGVANTGASDSGDYRLNSIQASPYWKPRSDLTLYVTGDNSLTFSTGNSSLPAVPTGQAPGTPNGTWGLNANNFQNRAKLAEAGVKFEPFPGRLLATVAAYTSERNIPTLLASGSTVNNTYKYEGYEASLRLQPTTQLAAGVNLSRIHAEVLDITSFSFSPAGFVPNNATVFDDSNVLNQRPAGNYTVPGIPEYSASGFVSYRLKSGFGAELSGWYTSSWYTQLDQTVKIPPEYCLDLNLSYRQPGWEAGVILSDITNQHNFENGLAGSAAEPAFLQPMAPFSVLIQGRIRL
jgi:hypothetical protein